MTRQFLSGAAGACTAVLIVMILASCGAGATAGPRGATSTPTPNGVIGGATTHTIIVPHTDLFAPYILVVNAGDSVTWMNNDTVAHTVVSAPRANAGTIDPTAFQFILQPGAQSTLVLQQPGVYYYYCGIHVLLNSQGRASAMPSMRPYPLPMDGVIYVRGPGLSAAPSAIITLSTTNQFTPWIVVVNRAASITWSNQTDQAQDVRTTPGYGSVNPMPMSIHLAPSGSATLPFPAPGIYDYYAAATAMVDPVWQRVMARPSMAGYPVATEGMVVVLDY